MCGDPVRVPGATAPLCGATSTGGDGILLISGPPTGLILPVGGFLTPGRGDRCHAVFPQQSPEGQ